MQKAVLVIFGQDFIQRVKDANNIYDVISSYVSLQRKGKNYWGCCPFHNEKTPSFCVDATKGFYKCYGCGKGGNAFTFLMDYKNMSFVEVVKFLADRAHIEIPQSVDNEEYLANKRKFETGSAVLLETAKFYSSNLLSGEFLQPISYLYDRGIDNHTIKVFGLGYSPDYYSLINHLRKKGFSDETMLFAGVASKNDKGIYDALAKRLIVPIINASGKVIGFGGRVMDKKPKFGKYKNTEGTPIFEKRFNMFGMNVFAKQRTKEVIIVEGYFDVISLYQAGIKNVVAPMGTALTDKQCDILKRFGIEKVYVCFDGDSAGQHATLRSLSMLADVGMEVKVVSLPNNMDPDDAVRKLGLTGFSELLNSAKPLIDYKLSLIAEKYDNNERDGRAKYAKEAINLLASFDLVTANVYVEEVANKAGVSKEVILRDLQAIKANGSQYAIEKLPEYTKKDDEYKNFTAVERGYIEAGRIIICTILENWEDFDLDTLLADFFILKEQQDIFNYAIKCRNEDSIFDVPSLYDNFPESKEVQAIQSALDNVEPTAKKRLFIDSRNLLLEMLKTAKLKVLAEQYKNAETQQKKDEIKTQIAQISSLLSKG